MSTGMISGSSVQAALLQKVGNGGEAAYSDELDDELSSGLQESLGLTAEEADALIEFAQSSAGTNAKTSDVIKSLLELLSLDGTSTQEVSKEEVFKKDITDVVHEALTDIAGEDGKFTADNAEDVKKLKEITGLGDEDVKTLIQHTGGDIKKITDLLFDSDNNHQISIDEFLRSDRGEQLKKAKEADAKLGEALDGSEIKKDGSGIIGKSKEEALTKMAAFAEEKFQIPQEEFKTAMGKLLQNDPITDTDFAIFKSVMQDFLIKGGTIEESVENVSNALKSEGGMNEDGTMNEEQIKEAVEALGEQNKSFTELATSMSDTIQKAADMAKKIGEGIAKLGEVKPRGGKGGGGGMPPG